MTQIDSWQLLAVPSGMGAVALTGAPWQVVIVLPLVLPVVHRYLRYRERLRELDVAEKAIDRSDTDRIPELMSTVYHHGPIDRRDTQPTEQPAPSTTAP
ncbi:hypothetical protein [Micromonospora fulviviridis]|uniref:hypothetical protein n=1 Tax=Micromonospora fulviviridis TaxID=47860 RepID=UPI0037BCCB57